MQPSEGNPPTMGATLYGKGVLEPVGPFCFLLMVNVVLEHLSHNTCEPLYFGRQCFLHGLRLLYCYQYSNLLGEISEKEKWYIATIVQAFTIISLYNCRSLLNQVTSKRDIIQFAESDFIVNKTWFFSDRLGLFTLFRWRGALISPEPKVRLTSNQAVNLSLWFVLSSIQKKLVRSDHMRSLADFFRQSLGFLNSEFFTVC